MSNDLATDCHIVKKSSVMKWQFWHETIDPFAIFVSNVKKQFVVGISNVFTFIIFVSLANHQVDKFIFKTSVTRWKKVNYHTPPLTPNLRILRYPIIFRNNFYTQDQNTFHTKI